ncbi:MAG TPA: type II toxin-antitoxin system VapC family toxin [Conexibacter sp.]|nr:type II toxin-antitoxin system VapC family toxin [Conexibacter sp.]
MTPLLLDSGVWLAARDADDANHRAAVTLLDGERRCTALDLTLYEVANVAMSSWRDRQRAEVVAKLVSATCADTLVRIDEAVVAQAIEVAEEHGISVYDATYAAVSRLNGWTLVSTDIRDLVSRGLAITPEEAAAN